MNDVSGWMWTYQTLLLLPKKSAHFYVLQYTVPDIGMDAVLTVCHSMNTCRRWSTLLARFSQRSLRWWLKYVIADQDRECVLSQTLPESPVFIQIYFIHCPVVQSLYHCSAWHLSLRKNCNECFTYNCKRFRCKVKVGTERPVSLWIIHAPASHPGWWSSTEGEPLKGF